MYGRMTGITNGIIISIDKQTQRDIFVQEINRKKTDQMKRNNNNKIEEQNDGKPTTEYETTINDKHFFFFFVLYMKMRWKRKNGQLKSL